MCHDGKIEKGAVADPLESGYGYKQTSSRPKSTSALAPKADETEGRRWSPFVTQSGTETTAQN
jgi:hypothetical protein